MASEIAAFVCVIGILGLLWLDRSQRPRSSIALWVPVAWLLIGGSRNVGEWLHMGGPENWNDRYVEGNPVDFAVLSALLALAGLALIRRRQQVGDLLRANLPIVLFFTYCGISILWSDYPFVAFKRWNRAIGDLLMALVILTEEDWVEALKNVFARVIFLLVPLSILLIRYFPELGRWYSKYEGRVFLTGVSTDKNGLGMLCLVFGLGSAWCFISIFRDDDEPNRKRRLFAHGVVLAMVVSLMAQIDSATAGACLVVGTCFLLLSFKEGIERKTWLLGALVLMAITAPLYALFMDQGGELVGALGRDPTLTGRTEVWNLIVKYNPNSVIGAGFESFWLGDRLDSILQVLPGLNQAHDGYIEIYLNLGWIGVTLLAAIIVTGFRKIMAAVGRAPHLGLLLLAYFVVALVYNVTEASFKMMSPLWVTFLIAVLAADMVDPAIEAEDVEREVLRPAFQDEADFIVCC
jgi:exopolysaccharide production protein ExoQ